MKKTPEPLTKQDQLKMEIAAELGLMDKIEKTGWKSLTARESGKIGGLMTKYKLAAQRGLEKTTPFETESAGKQE